MHIMSVVLHHIKTSLKTYCVVGCEVASILVSGMSVELRTGLSGSLALGQHLASEKHSVPWAETAAMAGLLLDPQAQGRLPRSPSPPPAIEGQLQAQRSELGAASSAATQFFLTTERLLKAG